MRHQDYRCITFLMSHYTTNYYIHNTVLKFDWLRNIPIVLTLQSVTSEIVLDRLSVCALGVGIFADLPWLQGLCSKTSPTGFWRKIAIKIAFQGSKPSSGGPTRRCRGFCSSLQTNKTAVGFLPNSGGKPQAWQH